MRKLSLSISILAALIAFVLLIADGAASIDSGHLVWTSGDQFAARLTSPALLERFQAYVTSKSHVLIWRIVKTLMLTPPALLVAAVLSLIFWLPARGIGRLPVRNDHTDA